MCAKAIAAGAGAAHEVVMAGRDSKLGCESLGASSSSGRGCPHTKKGSKLELEPGASRKENLGSK